MILYKRAKNGKVQQWSITATGDSYITSEGYQGGKITDSKPTVCVAKNVGRSNELTADQQAVRESLAKIDKKLKKGYCADINKIDEHIFKDRMLAHKYPEYKDKIDPETLIASQPKLDGIRSKGEKEQMLSREGNEFYSIPHIQQEVTQLLQDLPDGWFLDGELYNEELKDDFNAITSLVKTRKKEKLTPEFLQKSQDIIEYHLYDIDCPDLAFDTRYEILVHALYGSGKEYKYLKLVDTQYLKFKDQSLLDAFMEEYLARGYEGQMIRTVFTTYQHKRTKHLLKRKEFIDDEFEVVDITEGAGNRAGMLGRWICKDERGEVFKANTRGSNKFKTEWWINKQDYIGKMVTVRYQNLTPDRKVPRFGVVVAVRDYE